MEVKCNKDCFNCKYEDCICSDSATLEERALSDNLDKEILLDLRPKSATIPELRMTRYIRNRPDKEAYQKARDAGYDRKRVYAPEKKREYYQRVKEERKKYQRQYYKDHKDEISAKNKIRYKMNREIFWKEMRPIVNVERRKYMQKIVLANDQKVYGLTKDQESVLKEYLTFSNPKYHSAKRFSRSKYTSIPKYLTYYTQDRDVDTLEKFIRVPIGVPISAIFPEISFEVIRLYHNKPIKTPKFLLELREDQKKAFNAFDQKRCKTGIIQLPTGKGKSILGLYFAYKYQMRTLILVHKDDLVVGWKKDIKLCFGDIDVGLIKARKRVLGSFVTIATVQTLSRMSEEELATYTQKFGMVIQDEVHHIGANTFNIVDKFNAMYKIGLSATPTRSDGLSHVFNTFYGGVVYKHKVIKNDKDICQVKVIVQSSKVEYKPFCEEVNGFIQDQVFNMYDFKGNEMPDHYKLLEEIPVEDRPRVSFMDIDTLIVSNRKYKIKVCKDIIYEVKQGHSCIALFRQKDHIDLYYNYLKRFIPEDQIMKYYGGSKESSDVLMQKAESRKVLITLATFAKTTEGTNVKAWEVEFLVSSIANKKDVEQATGRIRRVAKGKLNPVQVYDYIHPGVYGVQSHYYTRKGVYKNLKYEVIDNTDNATKSISSEYEKSFIFNKGFKIV